jgi:uncharacterized UPF0160 family protein
MIPDFLVTHSGGFHADELMSSAVLTRLFPAAQLKRSRAPEWITPGAGKIIYDVGSDYDAEKGIFDHHQRNAPKRQDGQPYSSFGLIWHHYGRAYLTNLGIPEANLDRVHQAIDSDFVLPVDLLDNGAFALKDAGAMASLVLPGLLETLKPAFDDPDPTATDRAFLDALAIARRFLEARVAASAAKLRAEAMVQAAITAAGTGRVLELPMGMPFRSAIERAGADHLLFVIHPRDGDWCITGIRRADEGFALRADLPEAWAGHSGADLEAITGVQGATFCHNARFIAAAKTREAILALAKIAVDQAGV